MVKVRSTQCNRALQCSVTKYSILRLANNPQHSIENFCTTQFMKTDSYCVCDLDNDAMMQSGTWGQIIPNIVCVCNLDNDAMMQSGTWEQIIPNNLLLPSSVQEAKEVMLASTCHITHNATQHYISQDRNPDSQLL
jgi:hypothetical protein